MVLCPDPSHPERSLDALTDKELMRLEKSVASPKAAYIPAFPHSVIQAIVDADAVTALPLILAIHRQLTVTKRKETPLNGAIWKYAGSPSPKRKEAILRRMKSIPNVIKIISARTRFTHYVVAKGEIWSAAEH